MIRTELMLGFLGIQSDDFVGTAKIEEIHVLNKTAAVIYPQIPNVMIYSSKGYLACYITPNFVSNGI